MVWTKEKQRQCSKKHYLENKETYLARAKKWRKKNPEKYYEAIKRWSKEHPEKCREYTKKWRKEHQEKCREYRRRHYQKNREKVIAVAKKWSNENPEKHYEATKKWRKKNPEKVNTYTKKWREKNLEKTKLLRRKYRQNLKLEILSHYSNGGIKCAYCGEEELAFLSIDHSFGDGAKHRKQLNLSGGFYYWLKRNNYPQDLGLRILCMNCNWYFSHKKRKKKIDARVFNCRCQCCGEKKVEVLSFNEKQNKVLCRNCWSASRYGKVCPHQK